MSVTSSDPSAAPSRYSPGALTGRVKGWLADGGDRALTQRMAGTAFLIRVASAAIAYLSQVLLARWMGSFEFGIYVYVWTWLLLVSSLVDLGLASSAQRFIPEYAERKTPDLLRGFLSASRWLVFGIATLAALLGLGAIHLATPWLHHYEVVPLLLAFVTLPFFALTNMQDGIARSYNWVNLALLPPYIVRPLLILAVMAAAYLAGFSNDAKTAMMAGVIATWITAVIQLVLVNRRLKRQVESGPKAYAIGTWFTVAFPIIFVEGFYYLLTYTDVLVLQHYRPPNEIAVYHAASKTLALVAFVYFAVAAASAHKFTEYHVSGDHKRLARFLADSIRWTFWPSLAATVILMALGKPFLWLFGPGFTDGYHLMFILAVGLMARASVGPVERLLNMLGQQRICAAVYAGCFAFNLGMCIVLIPLFGAAGAALATALALVLESILLFIVTKRRLGYHVFVFGAPRE